MKVGQVLIIIGILVTLGGIWLGTAGVFEEETSYWVTEIEEDILGNTIWNGTGDVDETIIVEKGYLWVFLSQEGSGLLTNFSITDSLGNDVFNLEKCEDNDPNNDIDDCVDYSHYSIGNLELEKYYYTEGVDPPRDSYYNSVPLSESYEINIKFNTTGEVVLIDGLAAEKDIGDTIGAAVISWAAGMCGGALGCCVGILLLIIGIVASTTGGQMKVVPDPLANVPEHLRIDRKIV